MKDLRYIELEKQLNMEKENFCKVKLDCDRYFSDTKHKQEMISKI